MYLSEIKYIFFSFLLLSIVTLSSLFKISIFYNVVCISSILLFIYQFFLYKSSINKKISIYFLYIFNLYIFTFGQLYTSYTLFENIFVFEHNKFSDDIIIEGYIYSLSFIIVSFFPAFKKNKYNISTINENCSKINVAYSFLLVAIGMPFLIYQVYIKTTIMLAKGYGENLQSISGPVSLFSLFTFVGLFLIYYYSRNKQIKYCTIILFIFLSIISMAGGNRSAGLIPLIFSLYIIYFNLTKIKIKTILCALISIYCILSILYTIASVRGGKYNYSDLQLHEIFINEPYRYSVTLLHELGGTISNTFKVLDEINIYFEPGYGRSYAYSVFGPIPNINGMLDFARNEVTYVKKFKDSKYAGGSCIAESFYNFKWFGLVIAYLLASLCVLVSNLLELCLKNGKYLYASMLVIPSFILMWLPRDFFTSVFTNGISSLCILFLIYNIMKPLISTLLHKC